jgi:hypothetical protein
MKIGIAMFPTVDAPAPGRLGPMIEDRGMECCGSPSTRICRSG